MKIKAYRRIFSLLKPPIALIEANLAIKKSISEILFMSEISGHQSFS